MRLIGRNNDLIGQILKVLRIKGGTKGKEKKVFSKRIADQQEYGKNAEKKGNELTSGTVKLMAIFSRGRGSKTWRLVRKAFVGVLGYLG